MKETERIHAEDALKHLAECAQQGRDGTLDSVAGALELAPKRVADVLASLQAAGLATLQAGSVHLTESGRAYALQVVRAHRLYETYLAQETGHAEADWHRRAHVREHHLSREEVEALAQRLGHPRFDPHGDPIPTAEGHLEVVAQTRLSDWPVGEPARIMHLEDEPEAVYAQLMATGLGVGMMVQVLESTPVRLVIEAAGQRHVLAPIVAGNVSVAATVAMPVVPGTVALSELGVGERGRVISVSPRCRGAERRRLMDLGVVPETMIDVEMRSPVGDPTAYRILETVVALRRDQAGLINVVRVPEKTT
jgi:DtxR family Mn-dependent transcriptional regulator